MPSAGLPKYVKRVIAKGRTYHYFRFRGVLIGGPFEAAPGSPAFFADYADRLARVKGTQSSLGRHAPKSLGALIAEYQASPDFRRLAPRTQAEYGRYLSILAPFAEFAAREVQRHHIVKLRNHVAKSRGNRSADFFVAVASALFRVGLDLDYELSANPAHEIRRLAQSQSYPPWPFAARAAFLAAALPEWVRTCYMLGIWTTLRLSDVLTLPRSAFDGQGLAVTHGKTKRSGYIPAHSDLRAYLAELKPRGTIWVLDERGKPVSQTRASHAFREVLDGLGYPDLSFHGLRHTAATALAEAGASPQMIQAITGHQTSVMVEHYTRRREQKRLASEGMAKLEGTGTERETGKRPP